MATPEIFLAAERRNAPGTHRCAIESVLKIRMLNARGLKMRALHMRPHMRARTRVRA